MSHGIMMGRFRIVHIIPKLFHNEKVHLSYIKRFSCRKNWISLGLDFYTLKKIKGWGIHAYKKFAFGSMRAHEDKFDIYLNDWNSIAGRFKSNWRNDILHTEKIGLWASQINFKQNEVFLIDSFIFKLKGPSSPWLKLRYEIYVQKCCWRVMKQSLKDVSILLPGSSFSIIEDFFVSK